LAHYPDDDLTIAVLVNTRDAAVGALVIEGEVARVVLGVDATLADLAVDAELGVALEGDYVGDREATRYRIVHEDGRLVRLFDGPPPARLPLLRQEAFTFGRRDWPLDRFAFHLIDAQARAFSAYYNGFFDAYYVREAGLATP
jgi:hypothetical protein